MGEKFRKVVLREESYQLLYGDVESSAVSELEEDFQGVGNVRCELELINGSNPLSHLRNSKGT